ncbi:MAG: phosphodiester glycosidase family protein, partial [Candidatus Dormibacteria bacterium]
SGGAVRGPTLALDPAALASAPAPRVGDQVTVALASDPPLDELQAAIGGGPQLVRDGAVASDANAPAPLADVHPYPLAGAATLPSGELLLLAVDGRDRTRSIGLTRPQLAALMLALGARDGIGLDSGGSATLVARDLGEAEPSVQNVPSDGRERRVADGLFVYSDTPRGPPARLVVSPSPIVALPDVSVPVRLALVDAGGHPLGAVQVPGGDRLASGEQSGTREIAAAGLVAAVPVRIVARPAHLTLVSDPRDPDPGELVRLEVDATDALGEPVALGDRLQLHAEGGTLEGPGLLRAGAHDATITASLGDLQRSFVLPVGRRELALALAGPDASERWTFATYPRGGAGSLQVAGDPRDPELRLAYDFTGDERAAYARSDLSLPGEPLALSCALEGAGSGIAVRALLVDALGDPWRVTLVRKLDWDGWRRVRVPLAAALEPPLRLQALYVVRSLDGPPVRTSGLLAIRDLRLELAGSTAE